MPFPIQITFRNMPPDPDIEALVRDRAEKLERFHGRIIRCRVVLDIPHRPRHRARMCEVRALVQVPGGEIAVTREAGPEAARGGADLAVHDAFDEVRRRLQDHVRRRRGHVKASTGPPRARVAALFPAQGYGFLSTPDGRTLYFHRNSVARGRFEQLEIGTEVSFAEDAGEMGPQASTVAVAGRHRHAL